MPYEGYRAQHRRRHRFRTLIALIRGQRWIELRAALARSAFPPWAFRWLDFYVVRLRDPAPPSGSPPEVTSDWATAEDADRLGALDERQAQYLERLRRGDRCVATADAGGRIVCFSWFEVGACNDSIGNAYRFRLRPDETWMFDCLADPRVRGTGAYAAHWRGAARLLAATGKSTVYGAVQLDNMRSVRAHRKIGFVPILRVRILRLLGATFHRVEGVGEMEGIRGRGFGPWIGDGRGAAGPASEAVDARKEPRDLRAHHP